MTDPTLHCSNCERLLPLEAFNPSQRRTGCWCKDCRRIKQRLVRAGLYEPKRQGRREGGGPGVTLVTHGKKPSGPRWRRVQEQVWASETHCALCGEWVDQALHYNDSDARSVDHIIPIALGGAMYERDNVRLAHRSCNSKAGANIQQERLAFARAAIYLGSVL